MRAIEFEVVKMEDVPIPPVIVRGSRWAPAYAEMKKLGLGQRNAVQVKVADQKEFNYVRAQLRMRAQKEKLLLCSSRSADFKKLYVWLTKPE